MMGPMYYDPQGRPIEMLVWCFLFEDRNEDDPRWWQVGNTPIADDVTVSTVWMGLDHNWLPDGPPLIFETMVFGGDLEGECRRYSTWEDAEQGHAATVEQARLALALQT